MNLVIDQRREFILFFYILRPVIYIDLNILNNSTHHLVDIYTDEDFTIESAL